MLIFNKAFFNVNSSRVNFIIIRRMDILDNINIGVRIFFLILNIKEDLKKAENRNAYKFEQMVGDKSKFSRGSVNI